MQSKIAGAIALSGNPVAVVLSSEKPENSLQFKEGRWGCVISMLAASSKGRTAAFDRKTAGCIGGGAGLGFGNTYVNFPGGIEYFLSTGNPEFCKSEIGQQLVKHIAGLEEGERYVKTPELAKKFADSLPYIDVPTSYVLFKPLNELNPGEKPEVVVFLVNPDQLSALSVLANYGRDTNDNVFAPFGAGCHSVFLLPYREGKNPAPRAVIGLIDISARKCVPADILSFSIPYQMYLEMEANVEGSFLQTETWQNILKRVKKSQA